jgi:PAS domain S-box-containing protein
MPRAKEKGSADVLLQKRRGAPGRRKPDLSDRALQSMVDLAPAMLWASDAEGHVTVVNEAFASALGVPAAKLKGEQWLERVHPDDRQRVRDTVSAAVRARQPFKLECIIQPDVSVDRAIQLSGRPRVHARRFLGFVGTAADLTPRRHAEDMARDYESLTRSLAEGITFPFFALNNALVVTYWNHAMAEWTGVPVIAAVGREIEDLLPGSREDGILERLRTSAQSAWTPEADVWHLHCPHRNTLTCRVLRTPGGWTILSTSAVDPAAHASSHASSAEEKLRRSEERYRAFVEGSSEGILRFETDVPIPVSLNEEQQVEMVLRHGFLAECNHALAAAFGYAAAEDIVGARFSTSIGLENPEYLRLVHEFIRGGYRLTRQETGHVDRQGNRHYTLVSFVGTVEGGALVGAWGSISDITEGREAERRLRLLATTITSTRDCISITDLNDNILFVNDAFLKTYGYTEEELIGRHISLVRSQHVSPELAAQVVPGTLAGGWYGEVLNRRSDGTEFPVELWSSPVRNDEGEPVALVGVARDITERKRAEEHIKTSLREKEVLLKEIHHRVKNNLQVISSLLSLQAEYLKDEAMVKIFRESQNRVKSMALIHEKIYQSRNLAEVDFGEYLRELATQLFRSYGIGTHGIFMNIKVDKVVLGVDRAIPCGIIVNELVSNALKYAFPEKAGGRVDITLHTNGEGEIVLTVRDDGVGLPPDIDFETSDSLGLMLVRMLSEQLQGEVKLEPGEPGTEFTLTFQG